MKVRETEKKGEGWKKRDEREIGNGDGNGDGDGDGDGKERNGKNGNGESFRKYGIRRTGSRKLTPFLFFLFCVLCPVFYCFIIAIAIVGEKRGLRKKKD